MSIKLPKLSAETPVNAKFIVFYFYPKDDTPGCTLEAQGFRDHYAEFVKLGACIYGVSRDSDKSHEKFKCKYELPFELISDPEEKLCQHFDVMKLKKLYGKEYVGIDRSTFLFANGKLLKEWRGVKVPGHVEAVLEEIKQQK